ncbi:MAG: glycoside hydrolase family 3 protein, partial [Vallitaleaceae bacterium]|nr:glycoside hydrolase family 3 protein [Vallitaleaceae bacterium]
MNQYKLDLKEYARLARQAAAEGCVLLKNEKETLPLRKTDKIAVFGRIAFDYYKSGLGSGGLVNTRYVVGILDALRKEENVRLDEELLKVYEEWIQENPFDHGTGWGMTPWSQKEMPVSDELMEKAKSNDIALVIIGRTAGEDQDTKYEEGSYLLTATEKDLLKKVCQTFEKVVVVLNVGNLIDMSWALEYQPSAILYAWQGGQEGGNGVVDVLSGRLNPCGKLTDTIAQSIEDYPSHANFGDLLRNIYQEDIYVGYRYFETFAKDKVLYPFGFGLSYTKFDIQFSSVKETKDFTYLEVLVKNIGLVAGKEVVQVYVEAPQGKLGKASRVLVAFSKTDTLQPQESVTLKLAIPMASLASYDDSGVTGYKSAYVLEAGEYRFYLGEDVRAAKYAVSRTFTELIVVEQLEEACAPIEKFKRYRPAYNEDGSYRLEMEEVPTRRVSPDSKRVKDVEFSYTQDQGIRLVDVFDQKASLENFVAQLSDEDLIHLFRGEGMCSPKVTPGTAGAFGGVTQKLRGFGIPVACCADGPSGIRMDCGTKAFSLPNGTALGCTFNYDLVEELYAMTGKELRKNRIDTLLGPGMNIHRHPLNGRNFEYISEDPLVTGKISAAQVAGMGAAGVTGTIKHFCANNQEAARRFTDSIVSERALREIYLKGFEIA